jgi:glycine cleavage system aminomethyltransferase T
MDVVDLGKGHFLGREALAAIDASTPLRSVVVAVQTAEPVSPGEQLYVGGQRAGELTSVTAAEEGVLGLARVFWELRSGAFATEAGVELALRSGG